jgi:hypothetical protein
VAKHRLGQDGKQWGGPELVTDAKAAITRQGVTAPLARVEETAAEPALEDIRD